MRDMVRKIALYWASPDRKYRSSRSEIENGKFVCPRCPCEDDNIPYLRKAPYRREEGRSERLYVCPHCMFAIRAEDILGV